MKDFDIIIKIIKFYNIYLNININKYNKFIKDLISQEYQIFFLSLNNISEILVNDIF